MIQLHYINFYFNCKNCTCLYCILLLKPLQQQFQNHYNEFMNLNLKFHSKTKKKETPKKKKSNAIKLRMMSLCREYAYVLGYILFIFRIIIWICLKYYFECGNKKWWMCVWITFKKYIFIYVCILFLQSNCFIVVENTISAREGFWFYGFWF